MSGQQVDVMWFEHMGVFSEPIFNFSFVRLTLKQVGTLFGGLLFAYALAAGVNQIAGACVACLALLITFYRPRVMPLEQYVVTSMQFLTAKKQRVAEKKRVAALMGKNLDIDEQRLIWNDAVEMSRAGKDARAEKKKTGALFSFSFRRKKVSD